MYPTINTERSGQLYERACQIIPDGVSSSMRKNVKPILFFDRADGPYFYDVDGNRYLDYTLAWGPLIAGSNHPAINQAVISQLSNGYTFGGQHLLETELAERLVALLRGVEQILFCNTGTEAVQGAIRIARANTGRKKIVKFEGHYHGWLNNILVSYKPSASQLGVPVATCGGQPASEFSDTLVLPWNDLNALENMFRRYPEEIACVITEPILANSGCCMPEDGFLSGLITLCQEYGALSIFDEVITGFRIALGGARTYFQELPDLSVYAKAIAGGFTMAAIGGRKSVFEVLRKRETIHAGTYNGSPINLAAASATIDILSAEGQFDVLHIFGYAVRRHIEEEAKLNGYQLVTSGLGSVFSLHFGLDKLPLNYADTLGADLSFLESFRIAMLNEGILLLPDGRWYVGVMHGDSELKRTKQAITNAFRAMKRNG